MTTYKRPKINKINSVQQNKFLKGLVVLKLTHDKFRYHEPKNKNQFRVKLFKIIKN